MGGGGVVARRLGTNLVAALIVALSIAACSSDGAGDAVTSAVPTSDVTSTSTIATTDDPGPVPSSPGVQPDGFARTVAEIHPAEPGRAADPDDACRVCVWVADRDDRRGSGLMGVTDLGAAVGMVFTYDQPRTTAFTMRNTLLPLSIAFFGPDGRYLDAFDMEPCTGEPCPRYPTPAGFTVAIEVPQGELAALGIGPGSTLTVLDEECDDGP